MKHFSPRMGHWPHRGLLVLLLLAVAMATILSGCAGSSRSLATQSWSGVAMAGESVYVGTKEGVLIRLRADTGAPGATYEAPRPEQTEGFPAFYGTPTVAHGRVYVGGYNGVVYSLRQDDLGDVRTFEVAGSALAKGIAGNVVVAGDKLVFGAAEDANSGRIYVLDATTLAEICRYPSLDSKPTGKVWSTPLIVGNTAYVGDLSHHLHALSIDDCSSVWDTSLQLGGSIMSTPLFMNGKLYVGTFDRNFYEIDPESHATRVLFSGDSWFWASPVSDGKVIFAPNADGKMYSYDPSRNQLAWTAPRQGTLGSIMSSPVVVGSMLVVGSDNGDLTVLRTADGGTDWTRRIGSEIRAPLTANGNVVYAHTIEGDVAAINVQSKQLLWDRDLNTVQ